MPLKEENRTIVRVWTSKENKRFPGNNVGHVSIETPESYMSLWPIPFTAEQISQYRSAGNLEQKYLRYFSERTADYHTTYNDDFIAEDNIDAQVTFCFYNLNIDMMENEFYKLAREVDSWRLIGSNLFVQKLEQLTEATIFHSKTIESEIGKRNVDNCASLGLKILKAGEVQSLVSVEEYSSFSTKTSCAVRPDDLLELLIPAKLAELKKYPETQGFQFDNEVSVTQLIANQSFFTRASDNCLIL